MAYLAVDIKKADMNMLPLPEVTRDGVAFFSLTQLQDFSQAQLREIVPAVDRSRSNVMLLDNEAGGYVVTSVERAAAERKQVAKLDTDKLLAKAAAGQWDEVPEGNWLLDEIF